MSNYVLDSNGNPAVESDVLKWAEWYETAERKVALDTIEQVRISTVFLGLDHSFSDDGPPVLYETMIFGGVHDAYQERYHDKVSALAGHDRAVALIRRKERP